MTTVHREGKTRGLEREPGTTVSRETHRERKSLESEGDTGVFVKG